MYQTPHIECPSACHYRRQEQQWEQYEEQWEQYEEEGEEEEEDEENREQEDHYESQYSFMSSHCNNYYEQFHNRDQLHKSKSEDDSRNCSKINSVEQFEKSEFESDEQIVGMLEQMNLSKACKVRQYKDELGDELMLSQKGKKKYYENFII